MFLRPNETHNSTTIKTGERGSSLQLTPFSSNKLQPTALTQYVYSLYVSTYLSKLTPKPGKPRNLLNAHDIKVADAAGANRTGKPCKGGTKAPAQQGFHNSKDWQKQCTYLYIFLSLPLSDHHVWNPKFYFHLLPP